MAKAIPCDLRLHGTTRETLIKDFPSITAAKKWIDVCWERPYTIVRKKATNNLAV